MRETPPSRRSFTGRLVSVSGQSGSLHGSRALDADDGDTRSVPQSMISTRRTIIQDADHSAACSLINYLNRCNYSTPSHFYFQQVIRLQRHIGNGSGGWRLMHRSWAVNIRDVPCKSDRAAKFSPG